MKRFHEYEMPVAFSMFNLGERSPLEGERVFERYMCHWAAFNNIYSRVAAEEGLEPYIATDKDAGTYKTKQVAGVKMVQVKAVTEHDQIECVVKAMDPQLQHELITHPVSRFFATRAPEWKGQTIVLDELGQRLNGVLNVGMTLNSERPVWSPIDITDFNEYLAGNVTDEKRLRLAEQIVFVLYTVRNNLFHGHKQAGRENDVHVVRQADALLRIIVTAFLFGAG